MYEGSFGLHRRPFAVVPRVDQYFAGTTIESARQTLSRCIERAAGAGMVVGPSGTGKTLLCQMLAEEFRDRFKMALLCSGRLSTRRALFQAIHYELGQPYRGMDEGELRLSLIDYVTLGQDCPAGLILLVDEAHTLPLRLFEEIRMITNLVCAGQPGVRLVLAGGPSLEERLACPKLESLSQRLVARCYLEPFSRSETQEYVVAQVRGAGGGGEPLFTEDACQAVYKATGGVPRLVNQVCDHALLMAFAAGQRPVDSARIEEAWADLQQLPTPFTSQARTERPAGVIEFGSLDDAPPTADAAPVGNVERDEPVEGFGLEEAEAVSSDVEPFEQLEQIEQALADMDEEFHPAGAIGPEVELVLDDSLNPFAEEFAEEELIIDHYAPNSRPGPSPLSPSAAISVPGPEADPRQAPRPLQDRRKTSDSTGQERDRTSELNRAASLQQPAAAGDRPVAGRPPDEGDLEGQSETAQPAAIGPVGPYDNAEDEGTPETVPMHRSQDELPASREADLIVVEEGYEDAHAAHQRPIIPVRRQEYRQLFARLRRG
jgi:type II secretory pathway predicted ATPase ExeA